MPTWSVVSGERNLWRK